MKQQDLQNRIEQLNRLLTTFPWLDIDVSQCSSTTVILEAVVDLSSKPSFEFRFESVFAVELLMTWKTDTSVPVLQLLTGQDAFDFNKRYRVEQGHHLFAFQPEDVSKDARCIIAAQSFSWRELS